MDSCGWKNYSILLKFAPLITKTLFLKKCLQPQIDTDTVIFQYKP